MQLFTIVLLIACGGSPDTPAEPDDDAPVEEPARDAPAPEEPEDGPPTAADLIALIDSATLVEARSAKGVKPAWSKELPPGDLALLKQGIGDAEISGSMPRCQPTVMVRLMDGQKALGRFGAFCESEGPIGFTVGNHKGSFVPEDGAKVKRALESPVDR